MDLPQVVFPPNKPLERPLIQSKTPKLYDFMFFVDVSEKGDLISGCSNITGTYWEHVLFYYKDGLPADCKDCSGFYIAGSSCPDAKFIAHNKVVLAEDSGYVKLLCISDNGNPNLLCEGFVKTKHRVEGISVWKNTNKLVACSNNDLLIIDMGCSTLDPIVEFKDFHTQMVKSVDVNKNRPNEFASVSLDKKVCIWDIRANVVATVLYQSEFCGLTSVSWNWGNADRLAVGSESGDIYTLDTRQSKTVLDSRSCCDKRIHRIAFNDSGHLAVCSESSELLVLNENLNQVYTNKDHASFVRGLAWYHETLYSCGFDKQIIKHIF